MPSRRLLDRRAAARRHPSGWTGAAAALIALGLGCPAEPDTLPEGALARVGDRVFYEEDLVGLIPELGPYAQMRFQGREGLAVMLDALVDAELLAQAAERAGLGDDPRVAWALLEEVAAGVLRAELERRVPYESVAGDAAALRAAYEAHADEFTTPERRGAEGVLFRRLPEALEAHRALLGGAPLSSLGEVVHTDLQARDDARFPAFHPILFQEGLRVGDPLPHVVSVGDRLFVGRLDRVTPPERKPFDDPEVQARLVEIVRAPRLAKAREAYLAELAARMPARSGAGAGGGTGAP